jgi:hypothetical protein
MKNLAHSASFHSTEKIAPSKAGIKQLGALEWEGRNGDQTRWGSGDNSEGEAGDDNGIADERGALEQGYGFAI